MKNNETLQDQRNHLYVQNLQTILHEDSELLLQHANGLITDFELVESFRAAIGERAVPADGIIDVNTGLRYDSVEF